MSTQSLSDKRITLYSVRVFLKIADSLFLDNDGNVISKCGDFPNYQSGEENIPNTAKGMFHQSQFGYNTDRKRLACATSNVLELWEYKPETLTLHKRLLLAPYHYQFNSSPDGVYAESDNPDAELGASRHCRFQ